MSSPPPSYGRDPSRIMGKWKVMHLKLFVKLIILQIINTCAVVSPRCNVYKWWTAESADDNGWTWIEKIWKSRPDISAVISKFPDGLNEHDATGCGWATQCATIAFLIGCSLSSISSWMSRTDMIPRWPLIFCSSSRVARKFRGWFPAILPTVSPKREIPEVRFLVWTKRAPRLTNLFLTFLLLTTL